VLIRCIHAGTDQLPKPQAAGGAGDLCIGRSPFAPAIGPTIGGYLTENYGWQTIFFVNVIRRQSWSARSI